jgi:hypothetical protein
MEFNDNSQDIDIALRRVPSQLDPKQNKIWKAVFELDPDLAEIYRGALSVLSIDGQPDRMALSAHGIRELMEKIPKFLYVPIKANQESLKSKVNNLVSKLNQPVKECRIGVASFESDDRPLTNENLTRREGHINKILLELQEFFTWFSNHYPRKRKEIGDLFQKMDQGYIIPDRAHKERIQKWMETRDYFVGVAHHRKASTLDEFHVRLYTLEAQLFNYLCPEPFEDQDILDQIIEEAESGYQG